MRLRRPLGLLTRIALVLFGAVLLELLGNIGLHQLEQREIVSREQSAVIARKLADAERVASTADRPNRARLMHALSGGELILNWVPNTVVTDFSASLEPLATMRQRLTRAAPELAGKEIRLSLLPSDLPGRRDLIGVLALDDGSFVTFRIRPFLAAPFPSSLIVSLHVLLMLVVMGAALLVVRTLVQPLEDLAGAADATGRGETGRIVPAGPHEVRRVATAFAAMQTRLVRMVEDHTQALVAVSHDLRTPLQRLRLRAALLSDEETREAFNRDLSDMERFIASTLTYVRSGEQEEVRLIDLSALIATIADDACDLGADVTFNGPESLPFMTRRTAVQRILGNLVENSRRHAERIEITLELGGTASCERAIITVDDDGPGIPPTQREEAMLPFRRLGRERTDTEGAGLGLPSALRIAELLGGTLTLHDSPLGGLRARIDLPMPRQRAKT